MRTRLFLIFFLPAALFLAACSSTTVVADDEQATRGEADDSAASPTAEGDAADDGPAADDDRVEDDPDDADSADTEASDGDSADTEASEGELGDGDSGDTEASDGDSGDTEASDGELGDGAGFGLGGAEQLEALLDDCEGGSDLACDVLFQLSAFDSPEEDAAVTCGGRSDVEVTFCTEDVEALPGELVFDPESDGIDEVVDRCENDGDMTACDFLYYRSPIDSDLQEVGGTCGGRVSVAVPDCRTVLAEG